MAKYIKLNLTTPGGTTGSELLINIDQITRLVTASTTTTDIFFDNVVTATKKWTITHTAPLVANAVLDAIQSAMTANPGGVISTVVGPINTAQVPAAQGAGAADGRGPNGQLLITQPQVNVTFTSAAFTA